MRRASVGAAALLCAACGPAAPPPPRLAFEGLPVAGDRAYATASGFGGCVDLDAVRVRCRQAGVRLMGVGPFEAAVDLTGPGGRSGFDRLTLWRDGDQDATYAIVAALAKAGWRYCYTGTEQAGDQAIFTAPGRAVRVSVDISYYGKRRVRLLPGGRRPDAERPCIPDASLLRFGVEVARAAES